MKFIKEEPAGAGHTRYYFALGKLEARILVGLLEKALQVTPFLFETKPLEARMRNMCQVMSEAVPQMQDNNS